MPDIFDDIHQQAQKVQSATASVASSIGTQVKAAVDKASSYDYGSLPGKLANAYSQAASGASDLLTKAFGGLRDARSNAWAVPAALRQTQTTLPDTLRQAQQSIQGR